MSNVEYCSFVGEDSIICDCGVNFCDEDALRSHLELEHRGNLAVGSGSDDQTSNPQNVIVQSEESLYANVLYINNPDDFIFLEANSPSIEIKTEDDSANVEVKEELITYDNDNENEQENVEITFTNDGACVVNNKEQENIQIVQKKEENDVKPFKKPSLIVTSSPYSRVIVRQDLINKVQQQVILVNQRDEHSYDKGAPSVPVQDFVCELCGTSFNSNRALKLHAKRHYPKVAGKVVSGGTVVKGPKEKTVVCDICGKKYNSNAALTYHNRTHTGEKPYECTYCGKGFAMPLFLQIHTRIHTGERPYQCRDCEKKFTSRAALGRHERVHTGEKPYSCEVCGKCFSQSNSMKLHIHTVHLRLPSPYKSHSRKARQEKRMQKIYQSEGIRPNQKVNVAVKIPGLIRTTVAMDRSAFEEELDSEEYDSDSD